MWKYVIWSFCFLKPYKIKFSFLCRWFNHIIKIQNRITKLPCLPTVLRRWWKSISCKKTKIMFFQKRSRENCWTSLSHRWSNYWCTRIQWWWRNDRRSERNLCNCVKKPEKNSRLQRGLNPWPRDTGAMLYQLSYEATDVGSRSIVDSYVPVKEMCVNDIWNKSYMNCGNEIKTKKWSSQRTQFMKLRKEA